jgi:cysteinyl-tRNA synthetase
MEADRIRELLRKKGITLMDEKGRRGRGVEVTTWKYGKH